jgi:hypothetical protein
MTTYLARLKRDERSRPAAGCHRLATDMCGSRWAAKMRKWLFSALKDLVNVIRNAMILYKTAALAGYRCCQTSFLLQHILFSLFPFLSFLLPLFLLLSLSECISAAHTDP